MDSSPFIFGKTVSANSFTNREADLAKLNTNLMQGINTMLISPRRWGKSSLVERLIADIDKKDKHTKVVAIDLFSVAGEPEFLELFARKTIQASSGKWEDWLKSGKAFFQHLVPKLSIGVDPMNDFSISFDWQELKKNREDVLNLPERIAAEKGVNFIICLDEFQNLASFPGYDELEKAMRAVWQRQKSTTYCLYGSKRHMMTEIFDNPSKPFYRFGDLIFLHKIKLEKWVPFIQNGFKKTGKHIKKSLAKKIPQLMDNHSWYVQQLSNYTWQKTTDEADETILSNALAELIQTNLPFYQREIEALSAGQINLLKAIASQEDQLTSQDTLARYRLGTSANVVKNRSKLYKADIIDQQGKSYEFLDPAFLMWFKQEFLKIPYGID